MTVTPPSGVTDVSWITFNSASRTVSYAKYAALFDGDYTLTIYGSITNKNGV